MDFDGPQHIRQPIVTFCRILKYIPPQMLSFSQNCREQILNSHVFLIILLETSKFLECKVELFFYQLGQKCPLLWIEPRGIGLCLNALNTGLTLDNSQRNFVAHESFIFIYLFFLSFLLTDSSHFNSDALCTMCSGAQKKCARENFIFRYNI